MDIRHKVKDLEAVIARYKERAEKAESQLAELAAQEPVGKFVLEPLENRYHHIKHGEHQHTEPKLPMIKLFTRAAPPVPKKYNIGDATMRMIFKPTGMTNVSDMQAVFDQVECVLSNHAAPPVPFVDEAAFKCGVNALNDCLDDCGDSEYGLRLALRAMNINGA